VTDASDKRRVESTWVVSWEQTKILKKEISLPRPHDKMRSNSNAFTMESVSDLRGARMLGPVCDAVVRSATKIRDIGFLQSQFLNAFVRWVQFDEGFRPTTWIVTPLRKTAARMLRTSDGRARIHKQSQSCSRMPSVNGLRRRD